MPRPPRSCALLVVATFTLLGGCRDHFGAREETLASSSASLSGTSDGTSDATASVGSAPAASSSAVAVASTTSSAPTPPSAPPTYAGSLRVLTDGTVLAIRGSMLVRIAADASVTELVPVTSGYVDAMHVSGDERHLLLIVSPWTAGDTAAVVIGLNAPHGVVPFKGVSVQGGAINHDGSRVALGQFIGFGVYDASTGTPICTSQDAGIFDGDFLPSLGRFKDVVLATRVGGHAIVDANSCEVLASDSSPTGATGASTASPDGAWVASGVDGGHHLELKRTNPFGGDRVIARYECPEHVSPTWNHDGTVMFDTGIPNNRLSAFDPKTGRRLSLMRLPKEVLATAMFEDGRGGVALYGDRVEVLNAVTRKTTCKAALKPPNVEVFGVAVSRDRKLVFVSLGGEVAAFDAATCAEQWRVK